MSLLDLWAQPRVRFLQGDVRAVLPTLPANRFDCCVTSPPYFGLRDYGCEGQIGLENTLDAYLTEMVGVCREVRRVLKPKGTFWLNIGDSYAGSRAGPQGATGLMANRSVAAQRCLERSASAPGLGSGPKPKDLMMVPARLALALQADGWWVRSEIIWHKPNPMPESVTDRPTSAHEKIFMLTKNERYFFDATAVREFSDQPNRKRADKVGGASHVERQQHSEGGLFTGSETRNVRNVWTMAPKPFKEAHFAVFPPELAERCIKAGCPASGHVLDPFGGAGTTGLVAKQLGRNATLVELNPAYIDIAQRRIASAA